jgi:hypothetical protein
MADYIRNCKKPNSMSTQQVYARFRHLVTTAQQLPNAPQEFVLLQGLQLLDVMHTSMNDRTDAIAALIETGHELRVSQPLVLIREGLLNAVVMIPIPKTSNPILWTKYTPKTATTVSIQVKLSNLKFTSQVFLNPNKPINESLAETLFQARTYLLICLLSTPFQT